MEEDMESPTAVEALEAETIAPWQAGGTGRRPSRGDAEGTRGGAGSSGGGGVEGDLRRSPRL
jgi:hypothetical protein